MAIPNKNKLLTALEKSGGLIAPVALYFGVTRKTVYNWINRNPDLKEALEDIREDMIDLAQSKLIENIKKGDQRACEYYLDHMAQDRGYGKQNRYVKPDDGRDPYAFVPRSREELDREVEKYRKLLDGLDQPANNLS